MLAAACALLGPTTSATRVPLVMAGDDRFVPGPTAPSSTRARQARRAPGSAWSSTGWVDPRRLLRPVDLAVVPSVRAESFGLVAAEAMAAGVP